MTKHKVLIKVLHTISETDYEPYHSWSLEGWSTPHNDEQTVMAEANRCVDGLIKNGIDAEVVVETRKNSYPAGF